MAEAKQGEDLWLEAEGPNGVFAIFEEDNESGYFSAYASTKDKSILGSIRIYVRSEEVQVHDEDVRLVWSSDQTKCGVVIWGRMRAILDIAAAQHICFQLENRLSPAVTDPEWLKGFDYYVDQNELIRARQHYWRSQFKQQTQGEPGPLQEAPVETNFILYERGPDGWFAVFEDEGATGYLYLYDSQHKKVTRHLHLYDRSRQLLISPDAVSVLWAAGYAKCGVSILGEMRGIIDLTTGKEGRVWMESRKTPGIGDKEWLKGFSVN